MLLPLLFNGGGVFDNLLGMGHFLALPHLPLPLLGGEIGKENEVRTNNREKQNRRLHSIFFLAIDHDSLFYFQDQTLLNKPHCSVVFLG